MKLFVPQKSQLTEQEGLDGVGLSHKGISIVEILLIVVLMFSFTLIVDLTIGSVPHFWERSRSKLVIFLRHLPGWFIYKWEGKTLQRTGILIDRPERWQKTSFTLNIWL